LGFRFRKPLPAIDTGGILDFRPESIVHFTSLTLRFQNSIALAADRQRLVVPPQNWTFVQHIEAVTIFAFNFLKFRDAATERTALKHRIRLSWFAHPPYSALPINFAIIRFVLA
jgi:hypothetical protein